MALARVAVVGCGAAGAAAAHALTARGVVVEAFDKGRGVGGRLANRRAQLGSIELAFRHGAQYLGTGEALELAPAAAELSLWRDLLDAGVVTPVQGLRVGCVGPDGALEERALRGPVFEGAGGINAPVKELLRGCAQVRCSCRIVKLVRAQGDAGSWALEAEDGARFGGFDAVVLTMPLPQARALWPAEARTTLASEESVRMVSCWTTMLAFEGRLATELDVIEIDGPVLRKLVRQPAPEGSGLDLWVANASEADSDAHVDLTKEAAAQRYTAQVRATLDLAGLRDLSAVAHAQSHRWLYGRHKKLVETDLFVWDAIAGVAYASDALGEGGALGAFHSGTALAEAMAKSASL